MFSEIRPPRELDGPINADVLAPYADQRFNPDNEKRVSRVVVELAHDVLDLGVAYMDVPGFDDPSQRIWSATEEEIGQAHAFIFVIDVSSFANGGYTLDRDTVHFLSAAKELNAPVFILCNKVDCLDSTERQELLLYLRSQLEQRELLSFLPHPPFLVSAKRICEGQLRNGRPSAEYKKFTETLWTQLWRTESIGLRRLRHVFEQLRSASDQIESLVRLRQAQEPDRERLRVAVRRCASQQGAIVRKLNVGVAEVRQQVSVLIAEKKAAHQAQIAAYLALPSNHSPLPRPSQILEAFEESFTTACRDISKRIAWQLQAELEPLQDRVIHSVTQLRREVEEALGKEAPESRTRAMGEGTDLALPLSAETDRVRRLFAAGTLSSVATIGVFWILGAPLAYGLGLAALVGPAVAWLAELFANRASTVEELEKQVCKRFKKSFATFEDALARSIEERGQRARENIQLRMGTYREDVKRLLDEIRAPTSDELALYAEMKEAIARARAIVEPMFGPPTDEDEAEYVDAVAVEVAPGQPDQE